MQTLVRCGRVSRRVWGGQVGPGEQAAVDAAITSAFMDDSEEAWEALLEATGAAHHDDSRAEAPAIDVQHSSTGALTPSLPRARTGGLADVRPVHDRRNTPESKHSSGDCFGRGHARPDV